MAVKNSQRFAEIERLMGDYFGCHLAPVMGRVQRDLSNRQADEMRAYSNSTAGILRSLATANMPGDDPYATLKITGKWNSKTTEDYLAMCKEAIVGNKDMQRDLAVMAEEWRKAVVTEIGRERYDALSKQLGCDLAYAYIDHRMEQLMIEKMVKDRMPTSSADYIIRKAAQSSLFGLPYELNKSPLAAEIEAKGEAAYKPSRTEKAAGWAAGAGADVVAMGGIGSWATFAKFVGIDMVMNVGMEHLSKKGSSQEVCVEECISKGVFGTGTNVFASFRKQIDNDAKSNRFSMNAFRIFFLSSVPEISTSATLSSSSKVNALEKSGSGTHPSFDISSRFSDSVSPFLGVKSSITSSGFISSSSSMGSFFIGSERVGVFLATSGSSR